MKLADVIEQAQFRRQGRAARHAISRLPTGPARFRSLPDDPSVEAVWADLLSELECNEPPHTRESLLLLVKSLCAAELGVQRRDWAVRLAAWSIACAIGHDRAIRDRRAA